MKPILAGLLFTLAPIVAPEAAVTLSCEDAAEWDFSYSGERAQAFISMVVALSPRPSPVSLSPTKFIRGVYHEDMAMIYFLDENGCALRGAYGSAAAVFSTEEAAGLIPQSELRAFFGG